MALPTITVECAFGSTWQTASPTWTNITSYVMDDDGVQWSRGRGRDSESIQAGTATLSVWNRDDRFTPGYTAGPYGANVVPLVPIRITAVWSAVTYNLWRGFVREWRPTWSEFGNPTVQLDCVDALRVFGQTTVRSHYFDEVLALAPTYYWSLQDANVPTYTVSDLTGNGHTGSYTATISYVPGEGAGVRPGSLGSFDLSDNFADLAVSTTTAASQISGTADFTVALWWNSDGQDMTGGTGGNRKFFQQSVSGSNYVIVYYDAVTFKVGFQLYNGVTTQTLISSSGLFPGNPHFIVATRNGSTLTLYVDGTARASLTSAALSITATTQDWGIDSLGAAQNMRGRISDLVCDTNSAWTSTDVADLYKAGMGYYGETPTTRVARILDNIGWPAGSRDLDPAPNWVSRAPNMPPWPEDTGVLAMLQDCVTCTDGDAYVDAAGQVCFRDWYSRAVTFTSVLSTLSPSGYWPLNETSGTVAGDGHQELLGPAFDDTTIAASDWVTVNGTYQNTPTLDAGTLLGTPETGVLDTSVTFVASNSEYVSVSDAAQLEGTTHFVTGAWVNTATFGAERPIIAKSDAAASDWWLVIDSTGKLQCGYVNSGGTTRTVTTATGMTAGETYFVMGWWDDTYDLLHTCFIAMDGTVTTASTSTPGGDAVRDTTKQVWLGRRHGAYMNGSLSHVFFAPVGADLHTAYGLWRSGQADQMTFWKDATGHSYVDASWAFEEQRIRNIVRVEFAESETSTVTLRYGELSNATSITAYGERRDTRSGIPSDYPYRTIGPYARRLLARQAFPKLRVTTLVLNGDLNPAELWPVILQLDLGIRPVVAVQSLAGNIHQTWGYIDRVEHRMNRAGWETAIQLGPY